MIKRLLVAALLMASTSAFATSTTVNFSGHDNPGVNNANTASVSISYLGGSFDLTGILDPDARLLNPVNSGLYDGITLISDAGNTFTWAPTNSPLDLTRYSFSFSNLAAGNYTLRFNLSPFGGNYEGSYTITSVPVPEPETYGMMFLGLTLIGAITHRRRKRD